MSIERGRVALVTGSTSGIGREVPEASPSPGPGSSLLAATSSEAATWSKR